MKLPYLTLFVVVLSAQDIQKKPPLLVRRERPVQDQAVPSQEELDKALSILQDDPSANLSDNSAPQPVQQQPLSTITKAPPGWRQKTDVPLDETGKRALGIAKEWQDKLNLPIQGKDGRVLYRYGAGLPIVICAPLRLSTVELEPGEKLTAKPQLADEQRWDIWPTAVGVGDELQTIISIRPREVGLDTSLLLTTNRRLYYLRILSKPTEYMARVGFEYPDTADEQWGQYQNQVSQIESQHSVRIAPEPQPIKRTEGYRFEAKRSWWKFWGHSTPYFMPVSGYDNGEFVYIQEPEIVEKTRLPALMIHGSNGLEPANYSVEGRSIVIHQLFGEAWLIKGSGRKRQVVKIISPRSELKG